MIAAISADEAGVIASVVTALGSVVVAIVTRHSTKQLRPNDGSSALDAIRRMDKAIARIDDRTEHTEQRLAHHLEHHVDHPGGPS